MLKIIKNFILPIIILVLLTCSIALATGWHDYILEIDDGYIFFRNNSLDVGIAEKDGNVILFPQDYYNIGPVVRYQITTEYILTKNKGSKDRNLFEGDDFKEIDHSKNFFFIIQKSDNSILGPYKEIEFKNVAKEKNIEIKEWIVPKNSNYWRPFWGDLIFIAFSFLILMIKFFYITIPLLFCIGLIVYKKIKKA